MLFSIPGAYGTADVPAIAPLAEVLDRMEQTQRSIRDLRFKFVEQVRQADWPEEKIRGEVFFKRPHHLRITQTSPEKQIIISDGTTVWIHSPSLNQQMVGAWQSWIQKTHFPLPLIDFAGQWSQESWKKRYQILLAGYNDQAYCLLFRARNPEELSLKLWVSDKTYLPVKGELQGSPMSIQMSMNGMKVNQGIKESWFEPRVPEGTEIVKISF